THAGQPFRRQATGRHSFLLILSVTSTRVNRRLDSAAVTITDPTRRPCDISGTAQALTMADVRRTQGKAHPATRHSDLCDSGRRYRPRRAAELERATGRPSGDSGFGSLTQGRLRALPFRTP